MYEHAESFRSGALLGGISGATEEIAAAERVADQVSGAFAYHASGFMDLAMCCLSLIF